VSEAFDFDTFIKERNEALLSLDKQKITAYMLKYEVPFSQDERVFWASVHKARTAITSFPPDEIQKSRDWLAERGLSHMGDGQ
jgi:hypothetical protein